MNRLSACLITFNEEHNLPRALESVRGVADEIVVVDCGSRDRTLEIARECGAKVITNAWTNFAEQKNVAAAAGGPNLDGLPGVLGRTQPGTLNAIVVSERNRY